MFIQFALWIYQSFSSPCFHGEVHTILDPLILNFLLTPCPVPKLSHITPQVIEVWAALGFTAR